MNLLQTFKSLGPVDARNIGRDSSINWMLFIPLSVALLARFGVPALTELAQTEWDFDLAPYSPFIGSFLGLMAPMVFGMLVGFVLLDERDDGTLTALQISPLPLRSYFAYRISVPLLLAFVMAFAISWIAGVHTLSFWALLLVAVTTAPLAPLFALLLGTFASNKVQGFAVMKSASVFLFLPIFAYFIESPWTALFGVIPVYWPAKLYWALAAGNPNAWVYAIVGLIYQAFLLRLLLKQLEQIAGR